MALKLFYFTETKQGSFETLRLNLIEGVELSYGQEAPSGADYDILIAAFPSKELIEASPHLKAVIIPFSGLPEVTRKLLQNYPDIAVHNTPYNYIATAETALALVLASAKYITKADAKLRQNDWTLRYSDQPQLMLHGRTVVLLGYGRIGKHLAPIFKALGMNVIGVKRSLKPEDKQDNYATVRQTKDLKEILPKADILLIALPETPETVGLIGKQELAQLPKNAILINVGRGSIVNEDALFQALSNETLAAAGLDVWFNYPKTIAERTNTAPSKYPFYKLENVVMSPHKGGWLGAEDDSRMLYLAHMLNSYAQTQDMPNKIKLELGY